MVSELYYITSRSHLSTAIRSAIQEYKTKKLILMNERENQEEGAERISMEEEDEDESEGEQVREVQIWCSNLHCIVYLFFLCIT